MFKIKENFDDWINFAMCISSLDYGTLSALCINSVLVFLEILTIVCCINNIIEHANDPSASGLICIVYSMTFIMVHLQFVPKQIFTKLHRSAMINLLDWVMDFEKRYYNSLFHFRFKEYMDISRNISIYVYM